jgi:hypothetical protein
MKVRLISLLIAAGLTLPALAPVTARWHVVRVDGKVVIE